MQGFSQVPGVDYFDTFAPVAKLASIRAILAMAAAEDMELHQINIKGAYLNGLKQSGRRWYQKLVDIMLKLGFSRCDVDQAVFFE